MNTTIGRGLVSLAILLATDPSWAHHGYAVVFDPSKTVTLVGALSKMDWRNPHIEFWVDTKNDRGQAETWVIEAGPPSFFRGKNVDKSEFSKAIGQTVTVEALRARDGSLLGSLLKITFADGRSVTSAPGA